MCGIAGIYHYGDRTRPVNRQLLAKMTRLLAHRGPDGEGYAVDGNIGLGHRRLSIVDLSNAGAQPMSTVQGHHWLCYNGEFYDHLLHRSRLESRGIAFRGHSDTETLLQLLVSESPSVVARIRGIFSLAFWDNAQQTLTLARDHLGVKQLYYADDGQTLYFASEVKSLLICPGVSRQIDLSAVNDYLHLNSTLFERTFYKHIKQLVPGTMLRTDANGPKCSTYWRLENFSTIRAKIPDQIQNLRSLLGDVVEQQLQSDAPVGAFFSGGIDSSAIAAFASHRGHRLTCFGVHFQHPGTLDERPYQEQAAKALGLELQTTSVSVGSLPDDLERLMYFQDQPVVGTALVPMYHLSKLAATQVKVCLGGQAADETFAGYARYALAQPFRTLASALLGTRSLGSAPNETVRGHGDLLKQLTTRNARRILRSLKLTSPRDRYFSNLVPVPANLWAGLEGDASWISPESCLQTFHRVLDTSPARNLTDKLLHWDILTYLPGLLHQDDRMSMANSLESRVPFADWRLVEFACRTPWDVKLRAGHTKWLLRQAVAPALPAALLKRRKTGFENPVNQWLRGPHLGFVKDLLLSSKARTRGLWAPQAVERFITRTDHFNWSDVVWKMVSIELWFRVADGIPVNVEHSPYELRALG